MRSRNGSAAFKPLLPFAGSSLVEVSAAAALVAGCRLLLVAGCRGEEVEAAFASPRYRSLREEGRLLVVGNPRWEEGLLGSIQAGLSRARGEAVFVAHADMPFVRPEDYAALASARAATAEADSPRRDESPGAVATAAAAFFASFGGRRGHPVLLPSAWIPAIAALPPGEGLRSFLLRRPARLVETGPGALRDIDTLEDYERSLP